VHSQELRNGESEYKILCKKEWLEEDPKTAANSGERKGCNSHDIYECLSAGKRRWKVRGKVLSAKRD